MHSLVPHLLTSHAQAWADLGETKIVAKVDYTPFLQVQVLKEISLNTNNGTSIVDGEFHHIDIKRFNDFEDIIFYWK
jgi:hypothetical protein